MAPPFYFDEFPFFREPNNKEEVQAMMQRNDAFIISAAMSGLFKRVIWIWPIWDERNHEYPYTINEVEIGVAIVQDQKTKIKEKVFCICERDITTDEKTCIYIPQEQTEEEANGREISSKQCKIKTSIIAEDIREDKALERINKGNWLSEKEHFLLDIDEDFYGCTHAVQPLLDVNLNMTIVKVINSILEQLICPKTLIEEKLADNVLVHVLGMFRRQVRCNKAGNVDPQGTFLCKTDSRVKQAGELLTKTLWSGKHKMACNKRKGYVETMMMKRLVHLFKRMKVEQVQSLEKVGFCLTTTLKAFQPTSGSIFQICHGANVPGESVVLLHNPSKKEISTRTKLLKKILNTIEHYNPKMVTVCRSVRDGYTPRRYFKQIEHDVVKSLSGVFKRIRFNYDEGLLGGKNGWPSRHDI